jgi:hypothetical protein
MDDREAPEAPGGWVPLKDHLLALREADDRRYSEVSAEREKALKIKETADRDALGLAREIQTYKDEKANELREQINRERGLYATKDDIGSLRTELTLAIKPLTDYVAGQQGAASHTQEQQRAQGLNLNVISALIGLLGFGLFLYATFRK